MGDEGGMGYIWEISGWLSSVKPYYMTSQALVGISIFSLRLDASLEEEGV
jgi:hypothetical protein